MLFTIESLAESGTPMALSLEGCGGQGQQENLPNNKVFTKMKKEFLKEP